MPPIKVDIPAAAWEDNGPSEDPKESLIATLEIAGCLMHLEAHPATLKTATKDQKLGGPDWVANAIYGSSDYDDVQTVKIGRRHYVLIATPFAL